MQAGPAVAVAIAVAATVLWGCGLAPTSAPGEGTEGGPGAPVLRPDQPRVAGGRLELVGNIAVEANGCIRAVLDDGRSLFVIWPAGTTLGESGDTVRTGGRTFTDGDPFRGLGAIVPVAALPDAAYWREAHLAFCDPATIEVLVLDDLE